MLYGMSSFVDIESQINRIQSVFMTSLKDIMKLPSNASNVRIRVALGLTDMSTYLKSKTLKDYFKFKKVFGYFPDYYKETLVNKFGKVKVAINEVEDFLNRVRKESLRTEASSKGISLSEDYEERVYNGVYKYAWDKEFYVLYFFSDVGFFNHRWRNVCQHCGMENNRRHAVDECRHYPDWREKARDILECSGSIEDMVQIYYIGEGDNARWKRLMKKVNYLIQELYHNQVRPPDEIIRKKRNFYDEDEDESIAF
jgi:hypothetical protein